MNCPCCWAALNAYATQLVEFKHLVDFAAETAGRRHEMAAQLAATQLAANVGNAADESRLAKLQDEQRQDDEEKAATGAHFQQHFRGASICFNSHPVLSP